MHLVGLLLVCSIYLTYSAELRFVHASPDAPAVDVIVNGSVVNDFKKLSFGLVSRYVFFLTGVWHFQVVATGTTSPIMMDASYSLDIIDPYTLLVTDKFSKLTPIMLNDDTSLPDDGFSGLRIVHLAPDVPAIDVDIQGGPMLCTGLSFKNSTPYFQVNANNSIIEVKYSASSTVVVEIPMLLETRRVYSVFAEEVLESGRPKLKPILSLDL